MRLKNKVGIVTGAAQGIGRAIAERFLREGARVAVVDRDEERLLVAERELREIGSGVAAIRADVTNSEDIARMFDHVSESLGSPEILGNNAAWAAPVAHFLDMTEAFWDVVLAANLKSVFLCSQRFSRGLDQHRKPGCIVNISTYGAARSQREMSAYNASKGGVEALTRAMALDLAPWQVRVNAVGPGPIATPAFLDLFDTPEKLERLRQTIPLERLGQPADIANAALFLASEEAAFITGQVLYVDGGALAQIRPPAYTPNLKRPPWDRDGPEKVNP